MNPFYDITNKLKDALIAEPFINTVTYGSLNDIDLNKQNVFPLAHITANNAIVETSVIRFNMSILTMDIVDVSRDSTSDKFIGNDNEQDVLNTQLSVLTRVLNLLQRGSLHTDKYQVEAGVTCEPFVDRFENKLAGWAATFDVVIQNDMTICS